MAEIALLSMSGGREFVLPTTDAFVLGSRDRLGRKYQRVWGDISDGRARQSTAVSAGTIEPQPDRMYEPRCGLYERTTPIVPTRRDRSGNLDDTTK